MEVRGERECTACGRRWSYYETGAVECPACGSLRSRGVGERAEHTDDADGFDLSAVRQLVDEQPIATVADRAADAATDYVRSAGFVHGGSLQPPDDTYLAAAELRRVGSALARELRVTDAEEHYLLELLRVANGGRPPPEAVPEALRAQRGLAVAATAEAYVRDLRRVRDSTGALSGVLSQLRATRKRIEALDGDVPPAEAESVVDVLRDLHDHHQGEEAGLTRAEQRL